MGLAAAAQRGDAVVLEVGEQLADVLDPKRFKVNLIPYNPTGSYDGSDRETIRAFADVLEARGLGATIRLTRGRDIDAACGQLKTAAERKSRAELDRLAEEKLAALG